MKYLVTLNHQYHGDAYPTVDVFYIERHGTVEDVIREFVIDKDFIFDEWYNVYTQCFRDDDMPTTPKEAFDFLIKDAKIGESYGTFSICCDCCFDYITVHDYDKMMEYSDEHFNLEKNNIYQVVKNISRLRRKYSNLVIKKRT